MVTPIQFDRPNAKRIIERFQLWHDRVFGASNASNPNLRIPFEVMREYEDLMRLRAYQPGENYSKTLTLDSRQEGLEVNTQDLQMLYKTAVEKGWEIRVRGQHYAR